MIVFTAQCFLADICTYHQLAANLALFIINCGDIANCI